MRQSDSTCSTEKLKRRDVRFWPKAEIRKTMKIIGTDVDPIALILLGFLGVSIGFVFAYLDIKSVAYIIVIPSTLIFVVGVFAAINESKNS